MPHPNFLDEKGSIHTLRGYHLGGTEMPAFRLTLNLFNDVVCVLTDIDLRCTPERYRLLLGSGPIMLLAAPCDHSAATVIHM